MWVDDLRVGYQGHAIWLGIFRPLFPSIPLTLVHGIAEDLVLAPVEDVYPGEDGDVAQGEGAPYSRF